MKAAQPLALHALRRGRGMGAVATARPTPALGARFRAAVGACRYAAGQSLVDTYMQQTRSGSFRHSTAQVQCLDRLDALHGELASSLGSGRGRGMKGLYIYGDPGGGKTMMMDMFHEALVANGIPSRRAHFHDFMLDLNKELHRIRSAEGGVSDPLARVAASYLEKSPLLCFDECHVLNVGDAMMMRAFFERLFAAGGTVVATSNLAPDQLYSSGINREVFQPFIDAVLRHCDPVRLTAGEDFRTTKSRMQASLGGDRAFFWPLGPEADERLVATIREVRGSDEEPVAHEVPVSMGRKLNCRRVWLTGVRTAEFSYSELCEAAVGTFDYVTLSEAFDVLVVTGIPMFKEGEEDAARRLASLVDVLYDRHKRLLCTTNGPPRELFAAIRRQYGADELDEDLIAASTASSVPELKREAKSAIAVPTHGGSSGKHVAFFRAPKAQMRYTDSGGYGTEHGAEESTGEDSLPEEDQWVEWSATGLKDASMFDLTCNTSTQRHDRLLPLLRCESRLEEMSYLNA
mmetsp:Transcript_103368/g.267361  ORF Transcript_103368/g.267361 Transcript_103368/m.267361 type:complete len:518 (-) Transcript_103368:116-1669(-)